MILLLISWFFLLLISFMTSRLFLKFTSDTLFESFLGGVAILSIYLHLWAIFLPAKYALLPVIIFLAFLLIKNKIIFNNLPAARRQLFSISWAEWIVLFVFLFLAASPSSINDDAAYYQQTIQWLSNYGYIPGLANLKIHFGLSSSWHLISAAFHFDDISVVRYYNFNGLILWLLIISIRNKFPQYSLASYTLLPLLGAFFVNAPSPDLIVMCGAIWILINLKEMSAVQFYLFAGFLLTVKATAAGLLLFLLPILHRNKATLVKSGSIYLLFLLIFITRNILLTGHALFPIVLYDQLIMHEVPQVIISSFQKDVVHEIYDRFQLSLSDHYQYLSDYKERFIALFHVRSYKVIMNLLTIAAFTVSPLLLFLRRDRYSILLGIAIFLNGLFWFTQAPYYRFAIGFIIFLFFLFNQQLFNVFNQKILLRPLLIITVIGIILLQWEKDKVLYAVSCGKEMEFHWKNIFYPSDYPMVDYVKEDKIYVTDCAYCYNIPFPCYSKPVVDYYLIDEGYLPAPIDPEAPARGFFMKKIK